MNKKTFTSILQVALFSFEGATMQEIKEWNSEYSNQIVNAGFSLCDYLKSLEVAP